MNWLSKWLYKMVQRGERAMLNNDVPVPATRMDRMFGDCQPAIVAFRIENGYVMRTIDTGNEKLGGLASGYVYCKDHAAIAEHIVSEAARVKMGVAEQAHQQMQMKYGGIAAAKQAPPPRSYTP